MWIEHKALVRDSEERPSESASSRSGEIPEKQYIQRYQYINKISFYIFLTSIAYIFYYILRERQYRLRHKTNRSPSPQGTGPLSSRVSTPLANDTSTNRPNRERPHRSTPLDPYRTCSCLGTRTRPLAETASSLRQLLGRTASRCARIPRIQTPAVRSRAGGRRWRAPRIEHARQSLRFD
jgi:hypothetical protein